VTRTRFCAALLVTVAFTAATAEAMPIAAYDRLSRDDQSRYIVLLMNRTIAYLYAHGRNEHAAKLLSFFNGDEDVAEDAIDEGLETVRVRERETGMPQDVEHGVSLAIDSIDIQVSRDVLVTLVPDFKPFAREAVQNR
jgi:hypothetical protein